MMKMEKDQWPSGKYIKKPFSTIVLTFYNVSKFESNQRRTESRQSEAEPSFQVLLHRAFWLLCWLKPHNCRKTNNEKSNFVLQNLEQRYLKEF